MIRVHTKKKLPRPNGSALQDFVVDVTPNSSWVEMGCDNMSVIFAFCFTKEIDLF